MKRIVIIGCSGSGKTTLANRISQILSIGSTDLDNLRFIEGELTKKKSADEFILDVKKIVQADKWIVEGVYYNYGIDEILWNKADLIIWLDLPLWLLRLRIAKRSICRLLHGNKDTKLHVSYKSEIDLFRSIPAIYSSTKTNYPKLLTKISKQTKIININKNMSLDTIISYIDL